ncbi:MAG TPA: cyclic nucleotide-binding domain-containing protein [Kofleriaceae bacterium]|nr:cyclic nucleotide-binding domain-containing protein [Kofleriaceae bacterium]
MDDLERLLRSHPFLADVEPAYVRILVGCARSVRFQPGDYLMREGEHEDTLYLIRQGTVSIELPRPGGRDVCVETVGAGDVLGVSLMTKSAAHLDCRARETVLAFALDHACMRRHMDEDPRLGYTLAMRLLAVTYGRLSAARLQNLDVYR